MGKSYNWMSIQYTTRENAGIQMPDKENNRFLIPNLITLLCKQLFYLLYLLLLTVRNRKLYPQLSKKFLKNNG
jgi:hypothetical protein